MNRELEYLSYFGRGPEENYCDRNTGAALGWYQTTVQDCLTPYAKCQECGNRTEVRSFTLTDEQGVGLSVQRLGEDLLEISCLPVSAFELQNARHPSELPQQHYTHLKVLAARWEWAETTAGVRRCCLGTAFLLSRTMPCGLFCRP